MGDTVSDCPVQIFRKMMKHLNRFDTDCWFTLLKKINFTVCFSGDIFLKTKILKMISQQVIFRVFWGIISRAFLFVFPPPPPTPRPLNLIFPRKSTNKRIWPKY